ncbi:MAG: membrane protein insertase YidC [Gammaproteobacteria bacterium]|nr:membrane protein insertase YidC [Gammaproteobacteria bacterium]MYH84895.1 membrane protein insertase YidC [Gammaproteobacteria bacterium]MYK03662.1 membrane protein insertase YidC [Gammaproteobacteria bacterium]
MKLTRFFLYTSLAVITYLMLLAWQEDYPPVVNDGTDSGSRTLNESPNELPDPVVSVEAPDLPLEVPSESLPAASAESLTPDTTPVRTGLIQVTTDTLDLRIDPVGGDIVYLALPLYLRELDVPDEPFVLLESRPGREFVSTSGLVGPDGVDQDGRARYRATDGEYFLADGDDTLEVDLLLTTEDNVEITKRFTFTRDSYLIDISFLVANRSDRNWQANPFGQIRRHDFSDPSSGSRFTRTYLGYVITSADDPYQEIDFDDIADAPVSLEESGGWVGLSQHYFLSAWVPDTASANRYTLRRSNTGQFIGEFTGSALLVPPGGSGSASMRFYAGPKDQYSLAEISPDLDLTVDYSFLWFLAAPIYWLLTNINAFAGNYGVSIILLTLIVKLIFYKLSETQYRSMAGMRRLMPKIQQIKERYGDDRMKLQQATMDLYKKEKINPFGGCLPLLVQMPVFIALYWVLMQSVELRHAPFFLWLNDLSVRDPFFVLPLLMGATMFLQMRMSPAPADPMQAQIMKFMPIMMTVLFLWFPSGLVLYWLTNGLLSILQQWYITRKIDAEYAASR